MPSKSPAQARFFAMCASLKGRKKANKDCPPMSVAKEFRSHDAKTGALAKALKGKRS